MGDHRDDDITPSRRQEHVMKIAAFKYSYPDHWPANIGDSIQTLAVVQHLPRVDVYLDRDRLDTYEGDPCLVVMQGWFSHRPTAWPPSPRITPIFHGFHITRQAEDFYGRHVDYLRRHQPIGCRDRGTYNLVRGWGLDAYLSLCCTLTFPTRHAPPTEPTIAICDLPEDTLNPAIRKTATRVSHSIAPIDPLVQIDYARAVLHFYRDRASHLITSRIHAAMPCMAMGIPTLYIGPRNPRTDILGEVGVPERYIWRRRSPLTPLRKFLIDDRSFYQPRFEQLKADITGKLRDRLAQHGIHTKGDT
jgi:hypothetical protein